MNLVVEHVPAIAALMAVILAVLGVLFLVSPERALALSGHELRVLPGVMGGRYLGLAAIIIGLVLMGDEPALVLAFAIGAGLATLDAVLVGQAGGRRLPHVAAGLVSAVLAIVFWIRSADAGV